jgi:hypothetical protein
MTAPSSTLIDLPDRLLVRHGGGRRVAVMVFAHLIVLAAAAGFGVYVATVARSAPRFSVLESSWLPLLMTGASGFIALLFALLTVPACYRLSLGPDGWLRCGWAAWRFPGPMSVGSVTVQMRGRAKSLLELGYGAASLRVGGCASDALTQELAPQIAQWARSRVVGLPDPGDPGQPRRDNFLGRWSGGYWLLFALVFCASTAVLGGINGYYLNPRAALTGLALGAAAAFAVVVLAGASRHWLRMARREIETGAAVWLLDALAVLLLIVPGCVAALQLGQMAALRMQPAQETTLRQTVHTYVTHNKSICTRHLQIAQPTLARAVDYAVKPCEGWAGEATVEVRQIQTDLGVRILDVRRIEPGNGG